MSSTGIPVLELIVGLGTSNRCGVCTRIASECGHGMTIFPGMCGWSPRYCFYTAIDGARLERSIGVCGRKQQGGMKDIRGMIKRDPDFGSFRTVQNARECLCPQNMDIFVIPPSLSTRFGGCNRD